MLMRTLPQHKSKNEQTQIKSGLAVLVRQDQRTLQSGAAQL
jgi:hypothetical protein